MKKHVTLMRKLKIHALCAVFPPMRTKEFEALKDDIRRNGVRQPVITLDGQVIDGRHRVRACEELGIACPTTPWTGVGEVETLVLSLNVTRRHLSKSQLAATAVLLLEAEQDGPSARVHSKPDGDRAAAMARTVGCSRRLVFRALELRGPALEDVFSAVHAGHATVGTGERLAERDMLARAGLIERLARGESARSVLRPKFLDALMAPSEATTDDVASRAHGATSDRSQQEVPGAETAPKFARVRIVGPAGKTNESPNAMIVKVVHARRLHMPRRSALSSSTS
jgi:hypothetical protein